MRRGDAISCESEPNPFSVPLQALVAPVLLQLLDADHLETPLPRERKAVVSSRHVAVRVVRLDEFADYACFGQAGEAAEVCVAKKVSIQHTALGASTLKGLVERTD